MVKMDFIFDLIGNSEPEKFTDSKKDVLKYLKIIGVDTRFISYTKENIYINNLRFSKFSRKREKTFNSQYPSIKIVRSSLFQKICSKSSKVLSNLEPKDKILVPDTDEPLNKLMYIILEPYTRKYGIELVFNGNHDLTADSLILDKQVNNIFSDIFKGEGINFSRKNEKTIYPLINVSKDWINSFFENMGWEKLDDDSKNLASEFMNFLEDVAPQYKDNVLKASSFIEEKLKVKK